MSALEDIGLTAALLAAHGAHPIGTFLTVAFDFPLSQKDALEHLVDQRFSSYPVEAERPPATALLHPEDMYAEPLFAIRAYPARHAEAVRGSGHWWKEGC